MTDATATTSPRTDHTPPLTTQLGILAGPFLTMVDSSIVNVALPNIASQFHVALTTVQWVISGYLLALAAALAASAYLAKRFGTERVYLASLLGFTLASTLCALSPSIGILILARVLQGILGAPLVPLAMTMLLGRGGAGRQIPAAFGILLFLAPALGPTVGGLLIRAAGWPLIFLVNLPIGLLATASFWRGRQTAERGNATTRLDSLGLTLLAGGLALAVYGATEGPQHGWLATTVWPFWGAGLALLVLYVAWARHQPHPAVDLRLLRRPQTALAVALSALASVVMFGMVVLIPVFMEDLQHRSVLIAGLALFPQGIVTGLGTVLGNWLPARRGIRFSAMLGMAILTVTTASLLTVGIDTPAWVIALLMSGRGFAIGLAIQPLLTAMIGDLDPSEVPDANTLFNVSERLGGSIGISLLITFFQLRERIAIGRVLHGAGTTAASLTSGPGAALLPPALRARLAQAAVSGFHDTIELLIVLSLAGLGLAALLSPQGAEPELREADVSIDDRTAGI